MANNLLFSSYIVLLLAIGVQLGSCATWSEDASDIRHPGKCVIQGLILSVGEEYDPKDQCVKFICGEGSVATGFNCGSRTMSNCEDLGYADVSKPYPDCCEKKFRCFRNGQEEIMQL
ncbi:unnamed protein product [Hermetia illucens]|uniref:Single domain-containing protein n=1 Tax=Hermetia illucens TaxID=343691 RepID=A0A7R8YV09_HERIL|nr:uncharacterized protein LOC119656165 [Hermetia illucens]XP_037918439.1 uncharacterized protein LOC119656165 [Hermetia illucens]CAD7086767.1 unnamed protein product [Hermetia illucens]